MDLVAGDTIPTPTTLPGHFPCGKHQDRLLGNRSGVLPIRKKEEFGLDEEIEMKIRAGGPNFHFNFRRHVLRLGWRPCTSLLGPISLIRVGALGPGPRLPVILRLTAAEHGQTVTGRWHQEFKRVLRTRR